VEEITDKTTLHELATNVSDALHDAGIVATLSGGAAASIYTDNRYVSVDLDFVTVAQIDELKSVLEPLGFKHTGHPRMSVFDHPATNWYLEFPPAPLSFGGTYVDPANGSVMPTRLGNLRIISPTQSVMDRLIAAAAWHEPQSLELAVLVATCQTKNIDWNDLNEWVVREGIAHDKEVIEFYESLDRPVPS
jgi:hypothetical protein